MPLQVTMVRKIKTFIGMLYRRARQPCTREALRLFTVSSFRCKIQQLAWARQRFVRKLEPISFLVSMLTCDFNSVTNSYPSHARIIWFPGNITTEALTFVLLERLFAEKVLFEHQARPTIGLPEQEH